MLLCIGSSRSQGKPGEMFNPCARRPLNRLQRSPYVAMKIRISLMDYNALVRIFTIVKYLTMNERLIMNRIKGLFLLALFIVLTLYSILT